MKSMGLRMKLNTGGILWHGRGRVILITIRVCSYFSGYKNKDVAFYHKASKTAIGADLLFNLPGTEQVRFPKCKSVARFTVLTGRSPLDSIHNRSYLPITLSSLVLPLIPTS